MFAPAAHLYDMMSIRVLIFDKSMYSRERWIPKKSSEWIPKKLPKQNHEVFSESQILKIRISGVSMDFGMRDADAGKEGRDANAGWKDA